MPAKLILKSGYITNVEHMVNAINYAGTKIEAQLATLEDGTVLEMGAEDLLEDMHGVAYFQITLQNGRSIKVTPERYKQKMKSLQNRVVKQQLVTADGVEDFDSVAYIRYIAYRPSVEKAEGKGHGLFTLEGDADLEVEEAKIRANEGMFMWSHIISLDRADADRVGYSNRSAWQSLVTAKAQQIAEIYNISYKNLQVNAAYHHKDHHPHLHLYFYSTDRREGKVKDLAYASEKLRSMFFNDIFKDDVSYLKARTTDQRAQLETRLEELLKQIGKRGYQPPQEVCDRLLELSVRLKEVSGKKVYAFQSPEIKAQVDALVECIVTSDPHLKQLFEQYRDFHRQFVEQYTLDPEKIEAQMIKFDKSFFHPFTGKYKKKGSSDRAVLHNEVLRFAATLEGQLPTLEDISKESKSSNHKKQDSPMDIMRKQVWQTLKETAVTELQEASFGAETQSIREKVIEDEFATAYAYASLEAKEETGKFLYRMNRENPEFQSALRQYLDEQQKKKSKALKDAVEIPMEQLEREFFDPGRKGNRRLHDAIVRFAKTLEEQRAVIACSGELYKMLLGSLENNGNAELFTQLSQLAVPLKKVAPEKVDYNRLDLPERAQTNALLKQLLDENEMIDIPLTIQQSILQPGAATPTALQSTILKFAKKLEQHQAAANNSSAVYAALSDCLQEKTDDAVLQSLDRLQQQTRHIPVEELTYYKQEDIIRNHATDVLQAVLSKNRQIDITSDMQHEFLHPDALTPLSFQNVILRFSARLEEQKAVKKISTNLFSFLTNALADADEKNILDKLEEISGQLTGVSIQETNYRKVNEVVQIQAKHLLEELLNSKKEMKLPDAVRDALLEPDELTPISLQNTVLRFAAKLKEQRAVKTIGANLFSFLSNALEDTDEKNILDKLEEIFGQLAGVSIQEINYRKVNEAVQLQVKRLLEELLNSKKEMKLPDAVRDALLEPDELTPISLQNTVLRFAAKLEEQKAVKKVGMALFFSLSEMLQNTGERFHLTELEELAAQLSEIPRDQLNYRKMDKHVQERVNHLLGELLNNKKEMKLPDAVRDALLHPDEMTPINLQNTILSFAGQLEEHKLSNSLRTDLFLALLKTLERKHPMHCEMLELQKRLKGIPKATYHQLEKPDKEEVNRVLERLLWDHPVINDQMGLFYKLLDEDTKTPGTLQNTVIKFACKYDEYIKANIRFKTIYVTKMLMRSCAHSLAQMAREQAQYSGDIDPEQRMQGNTRITDHRPQDVWHNYVERGDMLY